MKQAPNIFSQFFRIAEQITFFPFLVLLELKSVLKEFFLCIFVSLMLGWDTHARYPPIRRKPLHNCEFLTPDVCRSYMCFFCFYLAKTG